MKVLEQATATIRAAIRGSTPALAAMFIANGIIKTVAPTLETTRVKNDVSTAMTVIRIKGETDPRPPVIVSARSLAAPVFSKAIPQEYGHPVY